MPYTNMANQERYKGKRPKFCPVCGSKLEKDLKTDGFDPVTGLKELTEQLYCSNEKCLSRNYILYWE